jgi:hypothetical protein
MTPATTLEIIYTVTRTSVGWAGFTLLTEDVDMNMTISYLYDSLLDLVTSANKAYELAIGEACNVIFMEEPGEYKMTVTKTDASHVKLSFYYGMEWEPTEEDYIFEIETVVPFKLYASEVYKAANKIFVDMGEEGYLDRWYRHPFPTEALNKLRLLQ